jgi:hypothetical protein
MHAQIGHKPAISARLCAPAHTFAGQRGNVPNMKITGRNTLDPLDLRSAVVGPDLVLSEDDHQRIVLHTVDSSRSQLLGSFDDVAEAWRALDQLECADELDIAA